MKIKNKKNQSKLSKILRVKNFKYLKLNKIHNKMRLKISTATREYFSINKMFEFQFYSGKKLNIA